MTVGARVGAGEGRAEGVGDAGIGVPAGSCGGGFGVGEVLAGAGTGIAVADEPGCDVMVGESSSIVVAVLVGVSVGDEDRAVVAAGTYVGWRVSTIGSAVDEHAAVRRATAVTKNKAKTSNTQSEMA
ncbi:MAG: hypothetical protein O3B95_11625 [Chloroflexi bacterium]|nr:hypothetical protein [Chloroflexota bacterium]